MESIAIKRFYGVTSAELSNFIKEDISEAIDDVCESFKKGLSKKNFNEEKINAFITHLRQEYLKSFQIHYEKIQDLLKEYLSIKQNVILPCDEIGQNHHTEDEEQLKSTLMGLRQTFKELYTRGKISEKLINDFKTKELVFRDVNELKNSSQEVKHVAEELLNSLNVMNGDCRMDLF